MTLAVAHTEHEPLLAQDQLGGRRRLAACAPYVLALFFSLWALRGVSRAAVICTDAGLHAMNGAFIYDMVRTGHITHPIAYAIEYYGHHPAISMPYHPPLFPAIESLFFTVLGVNALPARLAVSLAVGICAVLLYRLVQATLGSHVLATFVTATTLSIWSVQQVAADVMLEFPAFAFTLAALYCLRDMDRDYTLGRALLFAILASAAVWTKQHAAFLGITPVICPILSRHWRLLLRKEIWIASALFGAAILALMLLSAPFKHTAGANLVLHSQNGVGMLYRTISTYGHQVASHLWGLPGVFAVCAIGMYGLAIHKRGWQELKVNLYIGWILSVILVLLCIAPDFRYLFFVFPALITVGYVMLWRGCSSLWGERRAWYVPAGFAAAWFVAGLLFPTQFLYGPEQAAAIVAQGIPTRVIYAGYDGSDFIFNLRTLDPNLQDTVLLGSKLPREVFDPVEFERVCRKYGINWIVIEASPEGSRPWSHLQDAPSASMKLVRTVPFESSIGPVRSKIYVYRFAAPSDHPGGILEIPIQNFGDRIEVKL